MSDADSPTMSGETVSAMSGATIAELTGVTVRLGKRDVLHNVSLSLATGEIVALVGPNGAGKSSLLKLLAGLLPPTAGTVSIDARRLPTLMPDEIARRVAYLPQARAIHWPMTVRAIVALGRLPHRASGTASPARDAEIVTAAMGEMDITTLSDRSVLALSGGEQARVLMARALAQQPRLLIADEPTAGLDLAHQLALMQTLRARAASGVTCIIALHDLGLAARFADRIVLLSDGQIVAAGSAEEVLTPVHIAAVYGVDMLVTSVDGIPVFVPRSPAHSVSPTAPVGV